MASSSDHAKLFVAPSETDPGSASAVRHSADWFFHGVPEVRSRQFSVGSIRGSCGSAVFLH